MRLSILLVFICSFFAISCGYQSCDVERENVYYSPDSKRALVTYIENCGATTSYVKSFYMVDVKDLSNKESLVFRASKLDGLAVNWISNLKVIVSYKRARVHDFQNFWYDSSLDKMIGIEEIEE